MITGAASGPHDLVGVGFGPSGLALAVAFDDEGPPADAVFLERGEGFAWHEAMLIEGARLQVSCLKDLATLRDPCSRFTFLNYLRSVGRLDEFINLGDMRPTRTEFNDYLRWAAARVSAPVRFGREVVSVEPEPGTEDGAVHALRVTARNLGDGRTETYLARNLVVATGGVPRVPPELSVSSGRVFHSQAFLQRLAECYADRDRPWRFVVVGEGQSGAEIFDHLASCYPRARVTAALRGIGYRPMDETPFVNEVFFPGWVDFFYALPEEKRRQIYRDIRNTNYAVVDAGLIDRIYRRMYDARVSGDTALRIVPFLEPRGAQETESGVRVEFRNVVDGSATTMEADAVILATGYVRPGRHPLLSGVSAYLRTDEAGRYMVGRGYRVQAAPGFLPGVFLQGHCQETHGISDSLLSVISTRASEVRAGIAARLAEELVLSRDGRPRAPQPAVAEV
ncbi:MAG TPA: SidA/IucD/PvdA family monooxygenase [Longimicrobium sp.]|nr:SidA/IucD/PvdA family monooxygenase [Longimicrobium sp.]